MFGRDKVAMVVAEFLSAAVLASVVLAMIGRTNFPFFVAVVSGLTVGLLGYLFGTHTNPVVTIGLWTMRKVQNLQAAMAIAAQMLGGLAAWQLSQYLVNSDLNNIANAAFDWRVLTAEAVGALVFGIGVAAAVTKVDETARQAVAIGSSLAVGILVASLASNALLNPSVALGVQSWSWAYALGPVLGSVVGMSLYGLVLNPAPVKVRAVRATATRRKPAVKKTATKKTTARKRK